MYDQKVKAVELALRAVIAEAHSRGIDADVLCEAAMQSILRNSSYEPMQVADAVVAIEVAADTLVWRCRAYAM